MCLLKPLRIGGVSRGNMLPTAQPPHRLAARDPRWKRRDIWGRHRPAAYQYDSYLVPTGASGPGEGRGLFHV